jgi:hypothetical protein
LIKSGRLAPKHTDVSNGVRILHGGKVIVRRFHVIEAFPGVSLHGQSILRKSCSVGDCFTISIPAMDCSASSSSPGHCSCGDSLYVIEVHCKRLPTSGSGRLLAHQILVLTSLLMNPVFRSSTSRITFILTAYSLEGLSDFHQQNFYHVPYQ